MNLFKNNLILIIAGILAILVLFLLQGPILKVSAQILPIAANLFHLTFGNVFPGEELEKTFEVSYTEDEGSTDYRVIHKIKPRNPLDSDYCQSNPGDFQKCYHNLCTFLTEISNEGEGDTKDLATVGIGDLTDNWIVKLKVPAIFGNVAQDHIGGVINETGDYGCDLSIDIIGERPVLVDTVTVLSDGSIVNSVFTLENGKQYIFEASGTYVYWSAQLPEAGIADAKYSLRPEGSFNPGPGPQWISGDDLPSPWTNYLEILVNNSAVTWGPYNDGHIYTANYTGSGSTVDFRIIDSGYGDNSGSLTVEIYEIP